jgi:hypothetical protein
MKVYQNAHQPFLFKNNNKDYMLYCKKEKTINIIKPHKTFSLAVWNIYIKDLQNEIDKKIFNIENRIECNPSFFIENNELFLSFISSVVIDNNTKSLNYFLKKVKLDQNFNLISEEEDVVSAMSGFETDSKIYCFSYLSSFEYIFEIDKQTSITKQLDISSIANEFGRIIPIFNSNNYIVTDSLTQRSFLIENNFTSTPKQIKNNKGDSIYKCSILDNKLAYAIKKEDFEDRDIIIETGYIVE